MRSRTACLRPMQFPVDPIFIPNEWSQLWLNFSEWIAIFSEKRCYFKIWIWMIPATLCTPTTKKSRLQPKPVRDAKPVRVVKVKVKIAEGWVGARALVPLYLLLLLTRKNSYSSITARVKFCSWSRKYWKHVLFLSFTSNITNLFSGCCLAPWAAVHVWLGSLEYGY